jgi:hypothetical protein
LQSDWEFATDRFKQELDAYWEATALRDLEFKLVSHPSIDGPTVHETGYRVARRGHRGRLCIGAASP